MNVQKILLIVALVLAILAALGVGVIPNTFEWAFVFFVGSFLT